MDMFMANGSVIHIVEDKDEVIIGATPEGHNYFYDLCQEYLTNNEHPKVEE